MSLSALHRLVDRVSRSSPRGRRQASRQRAPRFRPKLEVCEDRTLLCTINWINPAGGAWNAGSNWDTGTPPGPGDDVCIPAIASTAAVTHSTGTDPINSLNSDAALVVSGGSLSLATASAINNNLVLSGGSITGSGGLDINGRFAWTGGTMDGVGATTANGGIDLSGFGVTLGRLLINVGTATLGGPSSSISFVAGAVLNNQGTFDVRNDNGLSGSGTFNNLPGATLSRSASAGLATIQTAFNNSGTVLITAGTLRLTGGGADSGSFTGAPGTTLQFLGGSHILQAASNVAVPNVAFGSGTVTVSGTYAVSDSTTVSGAAVTFNPGATLASVGSTLTVTSGTATFNTGATLTPPTLILTGGTLTGADDITVSSLFAWWGGTMAGIGTTTVSGLIDLGGFGVTLGRALTNAGTATWSGPSSSIFANAGAVFNNTGTFDIQNDQSFISSGCTGTFNNDGTFQKTNNYGTTSIGLVFNNTGTVDVQTGTVNFTCGPQQSRGTAGSRGGPRATADIDSAVARSGDTARVFLLAQVNATGGQLVAPPDSVLDRLGRTPVGAANPSAGRDHAEALRVRADDRVGDSPDLLRLRGASAGVAGNATSPWFVEGEGYLLGDLLPDRLAVALLS